MDGGATIGGAVGVATWWWYGPPGQRQRSLAAGDSVVDNALRFDPTKRRRQPPDDTVH